MIQSQFDKDIQQTLDNRAKLSKNKNLLYWYEQLYAEMFAGIENITTKKILEIGSGTSPLKFFYPHVLTSDVMPLDYLDYVFDAHKIDALDQIEDESLDIITLTNVLHHLQAPLVFLVKAAKKLRNGGQVIFAEPYFSLVSKFIYLHFHYEPSVFNITQPMLDNVEGPLSSSNQALPFMIFFRRPEWRDALNACYICEVKDIRYFTAISYMVTGGISKKFPVPHVLYRAFFKIDKNLGGLLPDIASSFFIAKLVKK